MTSARPTPLTDIRDNVQHLRKIHFSLLVACFVLFTLTFARGPNEFDKARHQLDQIRGALANWAPSWIESVVDEGANRQQDLLRAELLPGVDCGGHCAPENVTLSPMSLPAYDRPLREDGLRLRPVRAWRPRRQGLDSILNEPAFVTRMAALERRDPQFLNPVPRSYPVEIAPAYIARPESVKHFQSMWNSLGELSVVFAVQETAFWVRLGDAQAGNGGIIVGPEDATEETWPTVDLALERMSGETAAWWRDRTEHEMEPVYHLVGYTLWGEVSVPVEIDEFTLSLREAFISRHVLPWSTGTFATNFPDLSAAMQGRSELSLDETAALLASESAKLDADITIFGLAIPANVLSRWGGAIIVLAQFYFWLHLRGFARELRAISEPTLAPWIGVYDDLLARATTALSAFALPPLVLAAMIFTTETGTIALWLVVLASLGLGLLTYLTLRSCWALIDTTD